MHKRTSHPINNNNFNSHCERWIQSSHFSLLKLWKVKVELVIVAFSFASGSLIILHASCFTIENL